MLDVILYHYTTSPFAQKVRSVFGLKAIPWRSVEVPWVPPRPELRKLTGANRRIPVLQIGADVFCDSNLILRVLDQLFPEPSLRAEEDLLTRPISQWFEPRMMRYFASQRFRTSDDLAAFAGVMDPAEFVRERAPFMAPLLDITRRDYAPTAAAHVRAYASYLEGLLERSGAFLQGDRPGHADFSAFHPFWWVARSSARRDVLGEFDAIWTWVARIEALGEGEAKPIAPAEALAMAESASPEILLPAERCGHDPALGSRVSVTPDDYGCDPVVGELVAIGEDYVAIRREEEGVGALAQHFPRWGYRVEAA
jgi:glutathione S-transferase